MFDELFKAYADEWYRVLTSGRTVSEETLFGSIRALNYAGRFLAIQSQEDSSDRAKIREIFKDSELRQFHLFTVNRFNDDDYTAAEIDEMNRWVQIVRTIREGHLQGEGDNND